MARLQFLLELILRFLKGLTYDWIAALIDIIRRIKETINKLCGARAAPLEEECHEHRVRLGQ